jgi:hypothetical protein
MVGFELKGLIVILILVSAVINFMTYKEVWVDRREFIFGLVEVGEGFAPRKSFWVSLLITFGLFIYALYLNEQPPIILF